MVTLIAFIQILVVDIIFFICLIDFKHTQNSVNSKEILKMFNVVLITHVLMMGILCLAF